MGCLVADRNNFVLESVKFSEIGTNGIGIINIDSYDNKIIFFIATSHLVNYLNNLYYYIYIFFIFIFIQLKINFIK